MRRLVSLLGSLAWVACLEPGAPYLQRIDEKPPTVQNTAPAANGSIAQGQPLVVLFSEAMDERSLVPGIGLLLGRAEQRLTVKTVTAPAQTFAATQQPYEVQLTPGEGVNQFALGSYTLVLRTLLIDVQGNALETEQSIPLTVVAP